MSIEMFKVIQDISTILHEANQEIEIVDDYIYISKRYGFGPHINIKTKKPPKGSYNNMKEYRKIFYELNKDYFKEYREKNKDRNELYCLKYNAKRRAKRKIENIVKHINNHA